jgi:hypothetical protein
MAMYDTVHVALEYVETIRAIFVDLLYGARSMYIQYTTDHLASEGVARSSRLCVI